MRSHSMTAATTMTELKTWDWQTQSTYYYTVYVLGPDLNRAPLTFLCPLMMGVAPPPSPLGPRRKSDPSPAEFSRLSWLKKLFLLATRLSPSTLVALPLLLLLLLWLPSAAKPSIDLLLDRRAEAEAECFSSLASPSDALALAENGTTWAADSFLLLSAASTIDGGFGGSGGRTTGK